MFSGIFFGILAALFQAFSYIFSRHILARGGSSERLLLASQLFLGIISLIALLFFNPWHMLNWKLAGAMTLCSAAFIAGHFCFFQALKKIEGSRIASLMGIKVVVIPIILYFFFGQSFKPQQIAAILLAVAAAAVINYQGGKKFNHGGMTVFLFAVLFYSWSDIGVKMVVDNIAIENTTQAGIVGTCFNNLVIMLMLLPSTAARKINFAEVTRSIPYALAWGIGIMFLFVCFGYVGPAFGTVLQSSRGPMMLLAGIAIAHMGHHHLEQKMPARMWVMRAIAALGMFGSIVLYSLS